MGRLRFAAALLAGLCASGAAWAGETLRTGAAPAWVVPVAAPAAKPRQGALDLRLVDLQVRFDGTGMHVFARQLVKVLAPEGLAAAGNAVVQWQPALGDATVHAVTIHRDGQRIDALRDGKGFSVIRRESGLESMLMLDGELTALMPVPDLRVGDELEIAFTVDRANPVLAGHAEFDQFLTERAIAADRMHIRYSWPAGRAIRWRAGAALPKPVVATAKGEQSLVIDQPDYMPPPLPEGAPARFADANRVQLSDFADWSAVAGLMAPLYAQAATLKPGSAVAAEVARIAGQTADPRARAAAALAVVQGQVRYFAEVQGLGGYKPQDAEAVWAARRGDCKGKTVLLLAMLRGLGIAAEPALVSVRQSDGVDQSLPMAGRFDHVVVRAAIGGETYWLDGTRLGDGALDTIAPPAFRWALPLVASGAAPVAIAPVEPSRPLEQWDLDVDARGGLDKPARATGAITYRGEQAAGARVGLAMLPADKRDEVLRKLWTDRYNDMTVEGVTYAADPKTGEVRVAMTGTYKMAWDADEATGRVRYESSYSRLGRNLAPKRDKAAGVAPVEVQARHELARETILLPDAGAGFQIEGDPIEQVTGGVRYVRTAKLSEGRFEKVAVTRSPYAEISLADAEAADKLTDTLYGKRLYLRGPGAVSAAAKPGTLAGAYAALDRSDYAGALAQVDRVIAGGKTADALALRATIQLKQDRGDEADLALDNALAIDPGNAAVLERKIARLAADGRQEDALLLVDRMVLLQPEKASLYRWRGWWRATTGRTDAALADYQIAIDKEPGDERARAERIQLLQARGDRAAALKEAAALVAAVPGSAAGHALRAGVLARAGQGKEARAALARSLAIAPSSGALVLRARYGLYEGAPTPTADLIEAVRLEPRRPLPMAALRTLRTDAGGQAAVLKALDAAREAKPDDAEVLAQLADAYRAEWGDAKPLLARADKAVAAKPRDPVARNEACWTRATHDAELDRALADCDAGIAVRRDPATLDSRGFVRLRRGEFALALADYDAALAMRPAQAQSLYGRGIAKKRMGDAKGAEADLAAARNASADVDEEFALYGVTP
jgi:Tfp pilus assembly protein PilF